MKRVMEVALELKKWHDDGIYPFPLDRRQVELGKDSPLGVADALVQLQRRRPLVWSVVVSGLCLFLALVLVISFVPTQKITEAAGVAVYLLVAIAAAAGLININTPRSLVPFLGRLAKDRMVTFHEAVIRAHQIMEPHLPEECRTTIIPYGFTYARWSDLELAANNALVARAYVVVSIQNCAKPCQKGIEASRAQFRDGHATLRSLNLVNEAWDTYYRQAEAKFRLERESKAADVATVTTPAIVAAISPPATDPVEPVRIENT